MNDGERREYYRSRLLVPALLVLMMLCFLGGVYVVNCYRDKEEQEEVPPATFEDIEEDLPPDNRGVGRTVTHRENPVLRAGSAPTKPAADKAAKFAASYADSTKPAELPDVKLRYASGRLDLAVGDSKGNLHRQVTDCPEPCEAGVRDNRLFSESPREFFRMDYGKYVKYCGAATLVGLAIGLGKYDRPGTGAAIGGGTCTAVAAVRVAF